MLRTERSDTQFAFNLLTPSFGAVIEDVNAKKALEPEIVDKLKDLLLRYKVLFFPNQNLDQGEHERFASHFGPPRLDPLEARVEGHPGLALLDNTPFFHSDWMQQEEPTLWSMLQMTTIPDVGGDTMFADLVTSYEALSEPLRRFLGELTVLQVHPGFEGDGSALARSYVDAHPYMNRKASEYEDILDRVQPHSQPLVRYIPETGRKNYWISRAFSRSINELKAPESDALLQFLFQHQIDPQYVIRWKWHRGDIAFWDHRTTLHSGVKDYAASNRQGCRASIAGGRVIPASSKPSPTSLHSS